MSYNLAGAGYGHGCSPFTNVGAILVLFILLVIITRAFI
ncbi:MULTISPECIES: YjcZ family sporulation protein [Paenibacillus]|nr:MULTISPECIES: YjcZ family sporulation protein [Paenibacillus]